MEYFWRTLKPQMWLSLRILKRIPKDYPQVDMQNLVLIGSSNGAGMINR